MSDDELAAEQVDERSLTVRAGIPLPHSQVIIPLELELKRRREGRRERRRQRMLAAAVDAGAIVDELLERILADERFAQLMEDAVAGAEVKADERIQVALGRVAASALSAEDDAQVDEAQLTVRALRDLDPAHIRVLRLLDEPRPNPTGAPPSPIRGAARLAELVEMAPTLEPVIDRLVAVLQAHGLVSSQGGSGLSLSAGEPLQLITPAGERLLEYLRQ